MRRRLLAAGALAAILVAVSAAPASAALANPKTFFWAKGQAAPDGVTPSITDDIIYHGGNAGPGAIGVEINPSIYVVFWGKEWGGSGFTTKDSNGRVYTSATLKQYVNVFFSNLGGSPWAGIHTQYCRHVPAGTTSCKGIAGAQFITNPAHQLKGTWTDTTAVPDDIITLGLAENLVNDPIAAEAARAAAHFGWKPAATYFVLTPPRPVATGQPVYCGYHTQTTTGVLGTGNPVRLQYAFIPFLNKDWPGVGTAGCGMHNVNATSNAFGNGIFDGYGIVMGHEWSEAASDPDNFLSVQDGWNDAQGSENADKCAWTNDGNITLGSHHFAVQPNWSNEAFDAGLGGCVMHR